MRMRRVELLFDALRSPYDMAHIVQVAQVIDAKIYIAGNSLSFEMPKVKNKVQSWNVKDGFRAIHYDTFEEAVNDLRSQGKYLVGTSCKVDKIFYDVELPSGRDIVIVFGNESSGLSKAKQAMLDDIVKLPMDKTKVDFLTLPVAVAAMAYEMYRRLSL